MRHQPLAHIWLGGRLQHHESYKLVLAIRRAGVSVGIHPFEHVLCKPKSIEGLMESLSVDGLLHLQSESPEKILKLAETSRALGLTYRLWTSSSGAPVVQFWSPTVETPLQFHGHEIDPNLILVEHQAIRSAVDLLQADDAKGALAMLETACPEMPDVPPLELVEDE